MIRIIIHGCMGRMGQVLTETAAAAPDIEAVSYTHLTLPTN